MTASTIQQNEIKYKETNKFGDSNRNNEINSIGKLLENYINSGDSDLNQLGENIQYLSKGGSGYVYSVTNNDGDYKQKEYCIKVLRPDRDNQASDFSDEASTNAKFSHNKKGYILKNLKINEKDISQYRIQYNNITIFYY